MRVLGEQLTAVAKKGQKPQNPAPELRAPDHG